MKLLVSLFAFCGSLNALIPKTAYEVEKQTAHDLRLIEEIHPQMSVREWDRLTTHLFADRLLFDNLDWESGDPDLISSGKKGAKRLAIEFRSRVDECLLGRLNRLHHDFSLLETGREASPFVGEFTILSWKTSLMTPLLSEFFGSVIGWPERIDRIAGKILAEQPDLVVLSEVHDEEAAALLIQKLSVAYSYFVFNVGENNITSSLDEMRMNSGLFIASRFPLNDLAFHPFEEKRDKEIVNRGFLSFTVENGKGKFARVIATHLQPFEEAQYQECRCEELKEIYDYARRLYREHTIFDEPVLLVGDLNIPYLSDEYRNSVLATAIFYDAYTEHIAEVTFDNQTGMDGLSHYFLLESRAADIQISDYILLFKQISPCLHLAKNVAISIKRISAQEGDDPKEALSDHHALFARIKCPAWSDS